jgi:hypothetical protein
MCFWSVPYGLTKTNVYKRVAPLISMIFLSVSQLMNAAVRFVNGISIFIAADKFSDLC